MPKDTDANLAGGNLVGALPVRIGDSEDKLLPDCGFLPVAALDDALLHHPLPEAAALRPSRPSSLCSASHPQIRRRIWREVALLVVCPFVWVTQTDRAKALSSLAAAAAAGVPPLLIFDETDSKAVFAAAFSFAFAAFGD